MLQFGGRTSSYPAIKRDSAGVSLVLADDSGPAALKCLTDLEANTAGVGSPNILTSSESFKLLTNEGSTAKNYHTLPSAYAGLQYTFIIQDSDGMRITAQSGDTIRIDGSVSTSGGYAESSTIGNVITLVAINATEWIAISVVGTGWTTA
jgi:hypothetical protein